MRRALVVYASRHRGTAGIAERIAEVLRSEDVAVRVANASDKPDPQDFDAFVIGSGVYMGSWLKEVTEFVERNRSDLATKPVWLFSSGPLPGTTAQKKRADDPLEDALGPEEGPGSGGRKKIVEMSAAIHPRDHRVFLGAYDPNDPPRSIPERVVRMMPGSWKVLPAGDFREWDAIEAWARDIARELVGAPVAVG